MILPVIGYGSAILKKKACPITPDYPELDNLISNMFETMYRASGVGLAAPQINLSIRLVTIGIKFELEDFPKEKLPFELVLINPTIIESKGKNIYFNEGCLSVPEIHEDVLRPDTVVVNYFDANFVEHTQEFSGYLARIAQHEIDHLDGKTFIDRLSPLKRTLLKRKLNDIEQGKSSVDYRMRFAKK